MTAPETAPGDVNAPLGLVEPHAGLLTAPAAGQRLYKLMSVENLLRAVTDAYLHFNRVDYYTDFADADPFDGAELPNDAPANIAAVFEKAPSFSLSDYYARSRGRTYACCFSQENSRFIWSHYGLGSPKGQVGLEFDFEALRRRLNRTLAAGGAALMVGQAQCRQILSVNYGEVSYVPWAAHKTPPGRARNPVEYAYLKDERYRDEREVRVTLSAFGMGEFVLADGSKIGFPPALQMEFDFRQAIADGAVRQILTGPTTDTAYLQDELAKLGVGAAL